MEKNNNLTVSLNLTCSHANRSLPTAVSYPIFDPCVVLYVVLYSFGMAISDKNTLMALMKDFRVKSKGRWPIPTIIVQSKQARYRPPQNPRGCLQIMQAINVTDDQVCVCVYVCSIACRASGKASE